MTTQRWCLTCNILNLIITQKAYNKPRFSFSLKVAFVISMGFVLNPAVLARDYLNQWAAQFLRTIAHL